MKNFKIICLFVLTALSTSSFAGTLFVVSGGSLSTIKGQKVNVTFTYDNMLVGKMNEEEYLRTRAADRDEKEKGSGAKWIAAWKADRATKFEPKFIEYFNKYSAKNGGTTLGKSSSAKYTMVVNTDVTEVGSIVGFASDPFVKLTMTITETSGGKEVMKIVTERIYGSKAFDVGSSIQSSYLVAGMKFAKFMIKATK